MATDILALLEKEEISNSAHIAIRAPANCILANTEGNTPETQQLWSLATPVSRDLRLSLDHVKTKFWPRSA
jgi:hypothetical protein